jgi:hypothetical protein
MQSLVPEALSEGISASVSHTGVHPFTHVSGTMGQSHFPEQQ